VADVRLLNGGWAGWQAGGHPADQTEPPPPAAVKFVPEARGERLATKEQLLESLKRGGLQLVDARSDGEFCGTDPRNNKRAGAVPGAKQLEWSDLLDEETHRFKPAAEMRDLFARAGIELDKPTATHCQSGGRSSVMAFAMELMGADRVSNYYAGWGEWGNAEDTPVVPGTPKSTPANGKETK
jgi:thiosulfate/3-mercaptopyruvate sulfurtransferase